MRPTGPEVKEASVSLVGVTEAGGAHFMAEERPALDAPPSDGRTNGTITVAATYTIKPDGAIEGEWTLDTSDAMPAAIPWGFKSLPRAGVHVALPASLDRATWYGRGPHECYVDRADAAHVDMHSATLDELHVPYVYPGELEIGGKEKEEGARETALKQDLSPPPPPPFSTPGESGGRYGTRWLALTGASAPGVVAATLGDPVQANVSPFPMQSFAAAAHDFELQADGVTHVILDAAHCGVGGDDSWSPSVWEEYSVPPAVYKLALVLAPAPADAAAAAAAAAARWLARG